MQRGRRGCVRRAPTAVSLALCAGLTLTAPALAQPPQTGEASWYGPRHHGKRMSNGRRFDMRAPTMAHRTLPLGTRARVEHLGNGRSVVALVTDRGPFARGRIADLSRGLAEQLGMLHEGRAMVRITVVE